MSPKRKSLSERAFVFGDQRAEPAEPTTAVGPPVATATLSIDIIQDRHLGNARKVDPKHVADLADSIGALGLIEPLVVDSRHRLLAGAHRRAAILQLREVQASLYAEKFPGDQVPVQVMAFDSESDPDLALAIETAENEKRRDYTPAEIRAIAAKLKAAGYEDLKGRPKRGQKPLMPALSVVVGKSMRTVQRHLSSDSDPIASKSTTDDVLLKQRLLKQAIAKFRQWADLELSPEEQAIAEQIHALSLQLQKLIQ